MKRNINFETFYVKSKMNLLVSESALGNLPSNKLKVLNKVVATILREVIPLLAVVDLIDVFLWWSLAATV